MFRIYVDIMYKKIPLNCYQLPFAKDLTSTNILFCVQSATVWISVGPAAYSQQIVSHLCP